MSSNTPDFEQSEAFFDKSVHADERSSAVVLAAQSRYYLAVMLARRGEVERSQSLLGEIQDQFQDWDIPVWKRKCELMLMEIEQGRV